MPCFYMSEKKENLKFALILLLYLISISHVLNEQGTGYEHIFSSVQTFNID